MKHFRKLKLGQWGIVIALLILSTACGGNRAPSTSVLVPNSAGATNSYIGKPGNSQNDSALWNVTIDRSSNTYSYGPSSAGGSPTTGGIAALTGASIILLNQSGYQSGLALEIPGEAILLRPGDSTNPLVFAVRQGSCVGLTGDVKFLFNFTPGVTGTNGSAYGRIYATTTSDGSTWQFNNQTQYQAPDGKDIPANSDVPGYPGAYSGDCTAGNGGAAVSSSPSAMFNGSSYTVPSEYIVSSAGFFFEDQDYSLVPPSTGWSYPNLAAWGITESSTPISAGNVITGSYAGFLSEANVSSGTYRTRFVGFGNLPASGTVMQGGAFPNEDPAQAPLVNMSVTLGSQDPLNNGVFYFAKLTIPYDGKQSSCASPTMNNGTLSCTYNAIALVGRPIDVYAVFLSAFDANGDQKLLVLFQQ